MKKKNLLLILFTTSIFLSCKENVKNEKKLDSDPLYGSETKVSAPSPELNNLKIIPIEHATTVLEWNDMTIYVDPTGGAKAFEGQNNPDLILITDIHGDHFNVETLQGLNTTNISIVVPKAVADQMPEDFKPRLKLLNNGESTTIKGVSIEAIPMYNLREEAKDFHVKGRGNGYVLTLGDERVYFSGDTEDIPEMRNLESIDKAFVCMNLPYTMTVENAASAVLDFKPAQVYPYHYRGRPDVSDVTRFKELVNQGDTNIEVVQLDWYPTEDY